ncbi:MAG: SGNH/GDSL hydrolase family protein [Egibacteraceae bacterium]
MTGAATGSREQARGQRLALLRCAFGQVGFVAVRALVRRMRLGVATTRGQVAPFAQAWRQANARDERGEGPLWVVLGDSSAQGVGAVGFDQGYVGQLRVLLDAHDGKQWRVRNLSVSGARVADVVAVQLPLLQELPRAPDLVTCAVGANDLLRTPMPRLIASLRSLIAGLPSGAVIATLPQGLAQSRARRVNALIRAEAPARGLRVADVWAHTGPPWQGKYAEDFFHPNEHGYREWTAAFAASLALG